MRNAIIATLLGTVALFGIVTGNSEEDERFWNGTLMGNHDVIPTPANNFGWLNLTD